MKMLTGKIALGTLTTGVLLTSTGMVIAQTTATSPAAQIMAFRQVDGPFAASNKTQKLFLEKFAEVDLAPFKGFIWGTAGPAPKLNALLESKGFPPAATKPGVVGIVKLKSPRRRQGTETVVRVGKAKYRGASFKISAKHGLNVWQVGKHTRIAEMPLANGWVVYLTPLKRQATPGTDDLPALAEEVIRNVKNNATTWRGEYIRFPSASVKKKVDVGWFVGLGKGRFKAAVAQQLIEIKIDHLGAEAGVAFVATTRSMPQVFEIKGPYLAVFHRPGSQPGSGITAAIYPDAWMQAKP